MWDTGSMLVVIFFCCLHLVMGQKPLGNGLRTKAEIISLRSIRHSRSSGSESPVNRPNHGSEYLHFSKNAEGVPQLLSRNMWDSLGKLLGQPDTMVKQNVLKNLDGLSIKKIEHKYRPGGNQPQHEERNSLQGMKKDHVLPALPRPPVEKKWAKWLFKKLMQ